MSHVQAYMSKGTAAADRSIGAAAHATVDRVAFAEPTPSLRTAAHVVQQQAVVQLAIGVSRAGDRYERHADTVADKMVQVKSAEDLLNRVAGSSAARDTNGSIYDSLRVNRLAASTPRSKHGSEVQLLKVGMVLEEPNEWREITRISCNKDNLSGNPEAKKIFNSSQIKKIYDNNRSSEIKRSDKLELDIKKDNFPRSDVNTQELLDREQATDFSPEIDYIVPKSEYGANDLDNARVLSKKENDTPGTKRPIRAQQTMCVYETLNLKVEPKKRLKLRKDDKLSIRQITALLRYWRYW